MSRIAISLKTNKVHFFPRTPRLVAIVQLQIGAFGTMTVPFSQIRDGESALFNVMNVGLGSPTLKLYLCIAFLIALGFESIAIEER